MAFCGTRRRQRVGMSRESRNVGSHQLKQIWLDWQSSTSHFRTRQAIHCKFSTSWMKSALQRQWRQQAAGTLASSLVELFLRLSRQIGWQEHGTRMQHCG